jgi:hypothetical protein
MSQSKQEVTTAMEEARKKCEAANERLVEANSKIAKLEV